MRLLEDALRDLTRLGEIRDEATRFRTEGLVALRTVAVTLDQLDPSVWEPLGEGGEEALVLKALSNEVEVELPGTLIQTLGATSAQEILGQDDRTIFLGSPKSDLAFLRAARSLSALASAPTGAFLAPSFMLFYYVVVRELYSAEPPDWGLGGARAGRGGRSTAYVTSEFVRGLLTFARSLDRTAIYVGALAQVQEPEPSAPELAAWYAEDRRRRALFLYTTLRKRAWNLAVRLPKPLPDAYDDASLEKFQTHIRQDLITALRESKASFHAALKGIDGFRRSEKRFANAKLNAGVAEETMRKRKRKFDRSASAHAFAREAVRDAVRLSEKAMNVFSGAAAGTDDAQKFTNELVDLRRLFEGAASRVRRLVVAAESFITGALDRQITAAIATSETGITFDPIEMACAAATLATVVDTPPRDALTHAAGCLTKVLTDDGFPIGRPFHSTAGTNYQPNQFYALRSYVQLLAHIPDDHLNVAAVERVIRYFRKHARALGDKRGTGWGEYKGATVSVFETALATSALDRMVRMLDQRINESVLAQFSHRRTTKLRLRDLFYPDYGIAATADARDSSLAIALERMCAHVSAVPLAAPYTKPLYSAVFFGPPGTGKTTLAEALAASCDVPLVEITPSDIVVRGAEFVEERARVVFKALSLLTGVVILFDEFEEVLVNRSAPPQGERNIFHFLTPGMLPKLKTLSDAAKNRRVAYVLLTNDEKKLDEAAVRPGRFDERMGVYPPDLLSRVGRLLTSVQRYALASGRPLTTVQRKRCVEAIRKTRLAPMEIIGQPGWYSPPKKDAPLEPGSIFHYIFNDSAGAPNWPKTTCGKDPWPQDERVKQIEKWEDVPAGGHAPEAVWLANILVLLESWSPAKSR